MQIHKLDVGKVESMLEKAKDLLSGAIDQMQILFKSIVTLENSVSGAYDSDQILSLLE